MIKARCLCQLSAEMNIERTSGQTGKSASSEERRREPEPYHNTESEHVPLFGIPDNDKES